MNSILNKLNIKENNYGSCIGGSNWLSTSDAGEIISINPRTINTARLVKNSLGYWKIKFFNTLRKNISL